MFYKSVDDWIQTVELWYRKATALPLPFTFVLIHKLNFFAVTVQTIILIQMS